MLTTTKPQTPHIVLIARVAHTRARARRTGSTLTAHALSLEQETLVLVHLAQVPHGRPAVGAQRHLVSWREAADELRAATVDLGVVAAQVPDAEGCQLIGIVQLIITISQHQ